MVAGPWRRMDGWRLCPPRSPLGCHGRTGRSWTPRRRLRAKVDRDVVAALREQAVDFALERLEVLEALVDAGEPDVRDLVDATELLHGQRSDAGRRHLGDPSGTKLGLDGIGGLLRGAFRDRSARQRLTEAGHKPITIEFLPRPVTLHDDQPGGLDTLVGGEPHRTCCALAPAADRRRIVEVARVDDPRLPLTALRAAHRSPVDSDH